MTSSVITTPPVVSPSSPISSGRGSGHFMPIDSCSSAVTASARKTDRVFRNLSRHIPPKDQTTSIVTQDLIIDASAGIRGLGDLNPGCPPFISDPIAQGVGLTTTLCAIEGAFAFADTFERIKFARSIGDNKRTAFEAANLVKDGLLFSIGGAYAAYRPLRIATFYQGLDIGPFAPSTLGQAAYGALAVGNGLLGGLYFVNLCTSSYKLRNSLELRKNLTLETLRERLRDPTIAEVSATDDELINMVKTRAATWLDQMMDQVEKHQMWDKRPKLTEAQRQEIAWNMLQKNKGDVLNELRMQWPDLADQLLSKHNNDPILAMGHALKIDAERTKRTMDLNNILGADFVKELKAKDTLTPADIAKAKEILDRNVGWQVAGIFLSIAGLAWVIMSYISDPISTWIYSIQSLLCALVDAKGVKEWLANIHAGKGDMRMALISLATALVSMILVCILSTHFGLPVWMLILALTMDTFWIASNGVLIYRMRQPNLSKPSLDDFASFIKTCTDNGQAIEVFGRLEKHIRTQIEAEIQNYRKHHHMTAAGGLTVADLRRAVYSVMDAKDREIKQELEGFKKQLLSCIPAVI